MDLTTAVSIMILSLFFVYALLVTLAGCFGLVRIKTGRVLLFVGLLITGYFLSCIQ